MAELLPLFLIGAMIFTLLVVVIGIVSFAVYGRFYRTHSNNLMRLRVLFQAIALLCLALIAFFGIIT